MAFSLESVFRTIRGAECTLDLPVAGVAKAVELRERIPDDSSRCGYDRHDQRGRMLIIVIDGIPRRHSLQRNVLFETGV